MTVAQNFKDTGYLTFDTKPMGTVDRPLILRTYCPDPKLDRNLVLGNHSRVRVLPNTLPVVAKKIIVYNHLYPVYLQP